MVTSKVSPGNFNPRSPCGERHGACGSRPGPGIFQSTLPVWGATRLSEFCMTNLYQFQSTLPVWGATNWGLAGATSSPDFNPRSPCGERPRCLLRRRVILSFQSTLPVWGATQRSHCRIFPVFISIHAPRVGSDSLDICARKARKVFQSTLPVWGATVNQNCSLAEFFISIHAPRVGSDGIKRPTSPELRYFNPRSPCGERRGCGPLPDLHPGFQSTLPVWGATI